MKTIENPFVKSFLRLGFFLAVLFLPFSCSDDDTTPAPEEDNEVNYVSTVFVQGAPLKGANGIDIGADGNLYVASVNSQEIFVMDKNDGTIINRFGPQNGVLGPDDLVFGPDGTLYWTDILTGFVGRMTADGQQLGYQEVAPGVNPITFSPDGRLFVALDFLGDGLYELDPNLVEAPRPIIISTETNPFPLGFLNAFDFGEDGRLYGPLFAAGLVISVDVDRTGDPASDPFADGSVQVVAGGFTNPASAKFDPDGILTVLDQTGEVFKIDIATGEKTLFTTLDPALDNMVFDSDGSLYMTNADEGWVAEILANGQARNISPGGLILPMGLAVIGESLYEADLFNLRQFNGSSGQQENMYKGYLVPPPGTTPLILPMNISADGNNLIVSSWFSAGVQVWNPQNGVLENFPGLPVPIDAVRVNGDIVVSDYGLGGVVYASDNSLIKELTAASGLATDGETLWAADRSTGEIWKLDFDSEPTVVASGLENPEGLALDNEGGLLVVESGASRLSRIDLSTGEVTVIMEDLEFFTGGLGEPPTWGFDGVAVGPSGDIYVSGGGPNVIYRIYKE